MAMEGYKLAMGSVAIGAIALAISKGLRFLLFRKSLIVDVFPVPKKLTGVSAEVDFIITVDNPTKFTHTIDDPEIKLLAFGKEFSKSTQGKWSYRIEAGKRLRLMPISVRIDYLSLLTAFPDLVKDLRNKGKIIVDGVVEIKTDRLLDPIQRHLPVKLDLSLKT